jgi:NAD(P)-dependent dehydrogenase (short-subunit alcohol dehydrogenase family)
MTRRVAIITGGGSGIGRATALSLARRGYALVLAGRRLDPLNAVADEARAIGAEVLAHGADVTEESEVSSLFEAATIRFGRVDLLVNNAGAGPPQGPLEELAPAAWRRVIEVNLTGAFLCLQAAFRVMKAQTPQGGRIVNVGSVSAHAPRPNSAPYTASKHALTGLTKSAALDGRRFDIVCSQIDFGNTESNMAAAISQGVRQANGSIAVEPVMDAGIAGEAIAYMDSMPLAANVQFLTLLPTNMPFIGRG